AEAAADVQTALAAAGRHDGADARSLLGDVGGGARRIGRGRARGWHPGTLPADAHHVNRPARPTPGYSLPAARRTCVRTCSTTCRMSVRLNGFSSAGSPVSARKLAYSSMPVLALMKMTRGGRSG